MLLAALAVGSTAHAQSSMESAQDPLLRDEAEPAAAEGGFVFFGDALLRADRVRNLTARDDLERVRSRLRLGGRFVTGDWEFGAAVEGARGSDRNRDNLRNNDNEESDDANLDQFYARWQAGEHTALMLGKTALPLTLTPLTWDNDLRPIGLSVDHAWSLGELNRMTIAGGYFAGDHLYGDESRIAAAQLGLRLHEGAPASGEILLTFLHFDDLDELTRDRLSRTNRRVGNALVSDYRLGDLQLGFRLRDADFMPINARLDLVHNFGADDQDTGARFSLVLGSSLEPKGWEFGYAVQRIQRDAVMAAFNADDWWFHSFARGSMPWIAYGFSEHVSIQLSAFFERRDDQPDTVRRMLVDLRARW
jgi:hypothetical protein